MGAACAGAGEDGDSGRDDGAGSMASSSSLSWRLTEGGRTPAVAVAVAVVVARSGSDIGFGSRGWYCRDESQYVCAGMGMESTF